MSKKRMFSQDILCNDVFLDMPLSSQALYVHLCLNADDYGFVSPRSIMRMIGASADDLQILIAKRYILTFESGVVVIKHWHINNTVRKDRSHETTYKAELALLTNNEFGAYTEIENMAKTAAEIAEISTFEPEKPKMPVVRNNGTPVEEYTTNSQNLQGSRSNGFHNDNQMTTEIRLDKIRLDTKVTNVTLSNDGSTVMKNTTTMKDLLVKLMVELGHTSQSKPLPSRLRKLKVRLNTYTPTEILQAAKNIAADEFMQGDNDAGKRFGNIDYLLRSDETVDKWLAKDGPINAKTNHQELLRNAHI